MFEIEVRYWNNGEINTEQILISGDAFIINVLGGKGDDYHDILTLDGDVVDADEENGAPYLRVRADEGAGADWMNGHSMYVIHPLD